MAWQQPSYHYYPPQGTVPSLLGNANSQMAWYHQQVAAGDQIFAQANAFLQQSQREVALINARANAALQHNARIQALEAARPKSFAESYAAYQESKQCLKMAEIAQAAANSTKSIADSMASNRQELLQSSLKKEKERQAATEARMAMDRWRARDPEHNGVNAAIRYQNRNVVNQAWAANIGAGFKY